MDSNVQKKSGERTRARKAIRPQQQTGRVSAALAHPPHVNRTDLVLFIEGSEHSLPSEAVIFFQSSI